MKHLVLDLQAPMASFGSFNIEGERRTEQMPTKSSILGLVHACLGIPRADVHAGHRFVKDVGVLVACGTPLGTDLEAIPGSFGHLMDYQTTKIPPVGGDGPTVVTTRHYLTTVAYRAVLWGPDDVLEEILVATRAPAFTPYLGRKTCSLSLPMQARIVETKTASEAFDGATSFEGDEHPSPGADIVRRGRADDQPVATSASLRRTFRSRPVVHYAPGGGA